MSIFLSLIALALLFAVMRFSVITAKNRACINRIKRHYN